MRHIVFISITIVISAISLCVAADPNVYREGGIPATNQPWHGPEYLSTARILTGGKVALPRLADETGRRIFERLVSVKNLAFYHDKNVPLCARLQDLVKVGTAAGPISNLYFTSLFKGEALQSEAAQMLAFQLRITALSIELNHQLWATSKKEECAARISPAQQQRLMGIFGFAEATLSQRKVYSAADLSLVLEAMAETLSVYNAEFSDDYRAELQKKMEAHRQEFSGQKNDILRIDGILAGLRAKAQ